MEGTVWRVYPKEEKGTIRGDDGHEIFFRKSTLYGMEFRALCAGLRVSYHIQVGWLGKEAVDVHPSQVH